MIDIVVVADPRLNRAQAKDLANAMDAMVRAGWLVALLPVMWSENSIRAKIGRELADLLESGKVHLLSTSRPCRVRVGLGWHLLPFLGEFDRQPRLTCDRALLRVDRSWIGSEPRQICPLSTVIDRAGRIFGKAPELAKARNGVQLPQTADDVIVQEDALPGAGADPELWIEYLSALAPSLTKPKPPVIVSRPMVRSKARVLMLSPNGIGMGHLTRQLAISRRLPPEVEPVFVSMSQAVSVVADFGFHYEYMPGPHAVGVDQNDWTNEFSQRLLDAMGFYDARAVVFDGNFPYLGLVRARREAPDRTFLWLRRGLWRFGVGAEAINRAENFDLIIEPEDLAGSMDVGRTSTERDLVRVAPIILLQDEEMLSRKAARQALDLPPDAHAVLVQLGSGNNFSMEAMWRCVLDHCARERGTHVRSVTYLIAADGSDPGAGHDHRHRRLRGYPLARFFNAFDLAVSACGYNSFHELLNARLPTIFVPNENPMMDEQEARAAFAERLGVAFHVPSDDQARMIWALERLREPMQRDFMRSRMASLPCPNGADHAASLISLHALSLMSIRDAPRIPRRMARW